MLENILLRFVRMVSCVFKTRAGGEDSRRERSHRLPATVIPNVP